MTKRKRGRPALPKDTVEFAAWLEGKYPGMLALLGHVPDGEVARRFGKSSSTIYAYRDRLGIGPCSPGRPAVPLSVTHPGMEGRLGKESDETIAGDYGVSKQRVQQIRKRLGIPALGKLRTELPAEAVALLGVETDREISKTFGISESIVHDRRNERGIRPAQCSNYNKNDGVIELPEWLKPFADLLGKVPDIEISRRAGRKTNSGVSRWRKRMGIPAVPSSEWRNGVKG